MGIRFTGFGGSIGTGGGCCSCTICVVQCSNLPVVGALIKVLDGGGNLVAQCTTGSNGCCTVPVSGTYTVQVWISGTLDYSATRNLPAGGGLTVSISGANTVCCGGYAIPTSLTLTDAAGSLAFDFYPNSYYPIWYGGHAVTRLSATVQTPNGICFTDPASYGPVKVCYQMICYAGQNPTFAIQRAWSWVYQQGTSTPIWYQDPSGFAQGQPCATAPPASCGSPLTDTASDSENPSSTSPFAISFNPVPAGSNATPDPIGGTVSIS
jgi:hypothetical protein